MPVTSGEFWTEGAAPSKHEAIAAAVMRAPDITVSPGMKLVIDIDTLWEDEDNRFHAKIFFHQVPAGTGLSDDGGDTQPVIEIAHDRLLEPHDDNDTALHNTPDMEHAEEIIEEDFDHAVHDGNGKDSNHSPSPRTNNKRMAQAVPEPEGTEEKTK